MILRNVSCHLYRTLINTTFEIFEHAAYIIVGLLLIITALFLVADITKFFFNLPLPDGLILWVVEILDRILLMLMVFGGVTGVGSWFIIALVNPATTSIIIFLGRVVLSFRAGATIQKALTFVLLLVGLGWMGGFEYVREIARKPFAISNFIYSTSIQTADVAQLNSSWVLKAAKWTAVKEVTASNKVEAGKELFNIQCLCCHTVGGIRNDILPKTKGYTYLGVMAQLTGQGTVRKYMP